METYTITEALKIEVANIAKVGNELEITQNKLEVTGKNLVATLIDEIISISKQVTPNPDSKKTPKEYKQYEALKFLKAYNDNKYYQDMLVIAKGMIINKYDSIDYRNTSISDMKQLVELKPSKASVKKDFKEALKSAKESIKTSKAKEAKTKVMNNDKLKSVVSGLSSEELLLLKSYLNSNISAGK